ncbi:MAG: sugar ABC transporter substrate-binding protein, partial [Oscillospiraceae bacterium]
TALRTAQNMLSTYTLYNSKPFSGDYEIKQLLENSLPDFAKQDLQQLDKRVAAGENREELIAQYISQDNFEQWYAQFTQAAAAILIEKRV